MLIPHLIIVEEVLPEVRRRLSRSLTEAGWSQGSIAGLLGTSQAMVSKYLKDGGRAPDSLEDVIEPISKDLEVAALASGSPEELVTRFLSGVDRAMERGALVERYRDRFGREPPSSCYGGLRSRSSRGDILRDLEMAVEYLMENPIKELVPAVKINMACATDGARDLRDIAAFPGRIPDRSGKVLRPLPPEFGVSRHLARKLLDAMDVYPEARASINLRITDDIRKTIEGMDGAVGLQEPGNYDIVRYTIDPGGFGIEPCLYLFSGSPLALARFTVNLNEEL